MDSARPADSCPSPPKQRCARIGLLVFAVAFMLRAAWGLYRMHTHGARVLEFPDEQQYWLMASSLHQGEGLRDELGFRAGRMPLYPALLSLAAGTPSGVIAIRVAQWFLGALGAVLVLVLGTRLGGRTVGVLSGLMFAVDPFFLFFSNLVLTETLFVTLLIALWSYAATFRVERREPTFRQWLTLGGLSLACVYARESTLGLIGLALLAPLAWRRFDPSGWRGTMVVSGVLVVGLFPWALRNRAVLGEWHWLTTRMGISLYDGVRPEATGASDLGEVKDGAAVRGLSEVERNRYFLRVSIEQFRADPARIARLALRKFLRMWNPVPNAAEYQSAVVRAVSAAWMVPLFTLASVGAWARGRRRSAGGGLALAYLLLPAVYLSMLHVVFVGSLRYRLGAMPMLMVLAAVGAERLWAASASRRGANRVQAR